MSELPVNQIICDDCLEVIRGFPDNCIDALITDPPAGIGFMGKEWDTFNKKEWGKAGEEGENDLKVKKNFKVLPRYQNYSRDKFIDWLTEVMVECLRVLKPGAHGFVWALPRTSHWTATAIENAGFEIRDVVMHIFGNGFPKGLDISIEIDRKMGVERENLDRNPNSRENCSKDNTIFESGTVGKTCYNTAPATPEAEMWNGWHTGLKPAAEHWILCRKPISEKTIIDNVLRWGTGALNIDGCRIACDNDIIESLLKKGFNPEKVKMKSEYKNKQNATPFAIIPTKLNKTIFDSALETQSKGGRYPSHLVFSHLPECEAIGDEDKGNGNGNIKYNCAPGCPVAELNRQSGILNSGIHKAGRVVPKSWFRNEYIMKIDSPNDIGYASRFFYCAKASPRDREEGLKKCSTRNIQGRDPGQDELNVPNKPRPSHRRNIHPTVKSTKLLRYLCRLITPPGGIILDPFIGSGSTGKAAIFEGFRFIGIDNDREYCDIARERVEWALAHSKTNQKLLQLEEIEPY